MTPGTLGPMASGPLAERAPRRSLRLRRARGRVALALAVAAAACAVIPLILILGHTIREGASAISPAFFTALPHPVGEAGGGMANAIIGSLVLMAVAAALGLPVGIGAGLYVAESRGTALATVVRFLADVLNGLPSIVVGIFAWQFLVRPVKHFSALAGGIALAVMMVPLVARATEEMVRLVPHSLREAALALGYSHWRASLTVVLRAAMPGVVTASLVALARIAGETAPLLFTAFGNQFWSLALDEPIAALPLQIYTYAISPYDEWRAQAWAGSLVLIALALVIGIAARLVTRSRYSRGDS